MKRWTLLFLAVVLCFLSVGCDSPDEQHETLMYLGEWLGYNTDGDGDPMAQRLTMLADGSAEYAYDAFGEIEYRYSGTWTQTGEGMTAFTLHGGTEGENSPMNMTAACVVTEADCMVLTVMSGDNLLPDEEGNGFSYTFCRKDSVIPLIDGTWLGSNEDNDGILHMMNLTLQADGTAEYFRGFFDSDIIERYCGTWTRTDGILTLNLQGTSGEGDFTGVYIWNFRGADLVLVHADGDSFIDGADGGYFMFSSGDAVG